MCGVGSIAQSRYTYKYPHGYPTEEKDLASGRRRTRTVGTVRSGYRDNRAELSPTWTDQIDYLGSENPLRTSYVKQDGVSIKEKRRSKAGTLDKHIYLHMNKRAIIYSKRKTRQ